MQGRSFFSPINRRMSANNMQLPPPKKPPLNSAVPARLDRDYITFHALKGTYSACYGKEQISPLQGAMFDQSGALSNLYNLSQLPRANFATLRLVSSLFHKNGEELRGTKNKTNPAFSLTPKLLGIIANNLNPSNLLSPSFRASIDTEWRENHKKLTGDRCTLARMDALLKTIADSKIECEQNKFPLYLTETIITSYLIHISANREDILTYLKASQSYYHLPVLDTYTQQDGHYFLNFLTRFSKKEEKSIVLFMLRYIIDIYLMKLYTRYMDWYYENIIANFLMNDFKLPCVLTAYYSFEDGLAVANCFEAALHNLCNALLHNRKSNQFDFTCLPKDIVPHEDLVLIYTAQDYSILDVNSSSTGQGFMNLVSGHAFVTYCCDGYEVNPADTVNNFLALINHLFGCQAENYADLSKLLSDDRRQIIFTPFDNHIEIKFLYQESSSETLLFKFDADHAELYGDAFRSDSQHFDRGLMATFTQSVVGDLNRYGNLFNLLQLDNDDKLNILTKNVDELSISELHFILTSINVDTDYTAYRLVSLILPHADKSSLIKSSLMKLIEKYAVLEYAINNGCEEIIMFAITNSFDLNKMTDVYPRPMIHHARDITTVKLLVAFGANINAIDTLGNTMLSYWHSYADLDVLYELGAVNTSASPRLR